MDFPAMLHIAVVVVLFFAAPGVSDQNLETFTAEYGPFDDSLSAYAVFEVIPPATVSNDALQITPDSASSDFDLRNNQGRVMLRRGFKLLQDTNGSYLDRVGSFYSSFLTNIFSLDGFTIGEGLAFGVAPNLNQPSNSSGQYLGLTNSTTDGDAANHLLAVELDTFKEEFDPDANHVGLNVNSVVSKKTTSLTPLKIQLAPLGNASFFNVWVDYNGVSKVIEVYIAQIPTMDGQIPLRPAEPVLKEYVDLREVVNQYSYFGFSASTGKVGVQLNCILKWNLTVDYYPEGRYKVDNKSPEGRYKVDNKSRRWKKILPQAGAFLLVVLLTGTVGLDFYRRRKRRAESSKSSIVEALRRLPGTPKEFHFKDLKKATNDFDEKSKLGQGGFGVVYRGNLRNEDLEVAVKWFSRENTKGQDDFLAELTIINRLRHKHLVRLLGWCHKNGKMLLVYEYMPNGSLDMHLFGNRASGELLSWDVRYKIILGVVSALHYLHNEYNQRVVHRDLKASNIMLDSDFNARLGDFGLARVLDNEKTSYTEADGVAGTIGYIAPECFHTGKATQQSDVYALGAVVLEVVCGLRLGTEIVSFICLVDWVWSLHRDGNLLEAVDRRLGDDYVAEEAQRLLLLGLACSHPVASERPQTRDIFQIVSGLVPMPFVPPFKPAFVWPAVPLGIEYLSQSTSLYNDSSCSGRHLTAVSVT